MLQSVVSQQMLGATDLRSPTEFSVERDLRSSREDSMFERTLEEKMSSQKLKESSPQEPKVAKDRSETREKKESRDSERSSESADKREMSVRKPQEKVAKNRKQAIQEFMDSFESEFQIPPTRLAEAMAQLSKDELNQAPEETVGTVVSQLGLNDSQADKAAAMYAGLLAQLNKIDQTVTVTPEVALNQGNPQQLMQDRIALTQLEQSVQANSVEDLNKKFWASPNQNASQGSALTQEEVLAQALEKKASLENLPPHLQGQMSEVVSPKLLAALAAKKAAMAQAGASSSDSQEASNLVGEFQQVLQNPADAQTVKAMGANADGKMSQDFFNNQAGKQSLMASEMEKTGADALKSAKLDPSSELLDLKSMTGAEGAMAQPLRAERLGSDFFVPPTLGAGASAQNNVESEANIKQIMSQAQYLVQKGGGEMRVKMHPEGLGSIDLKVMLQDGKVNLQMSADTQEAKKMIESSLVDLKTSLAAQKLSVENVKVDVVNSTSADTATQNQTNMNGQNNRDHSRQFWNQFNENFGSQGRRESLMEMPNLKGYGQRERSPLSPIEGSSASQARKVQGKGAGLNLVA